MLMIRLRRTGAKKDPHYRVVVADRAAGRDGAFLEILGHYHPRQQPAEIVFNMERTEIWLGQGARMSDTVRNLYRRVRSGRVEAAPEVPEVEAASTPAEAPSDTELEAAAEVEAEVEVEAEAPDASADAAASADEEAKGTPQED